MISRTTLFCYRFIYLFSFTYITFSKNTDLLILQAFDILIHQHGKDVDNTR